MLPEITERQWRAAASKLPDAKQWYESSRRVCEMFVPFEGPVLAYKVTDFIALQPRRVAFFVYKMTCATGKDYYLWRRESC